MTTQHKSRIKWVLFLASGTLLSIGFLDTMTRRTNCGGNTAASSKCQMVVLTAMGALTNDNRNFDLRKLSPDARNEIAASYNSNWIRSAKILLRTNFVFEKTNRVIVAVCDTEFSNVPQPNFWNGFKRTPAHAVAYSDLEAGFISPAEFAKLDLKEFVDARSITNGAAQIPNLATDR